MPKKAAIKIISFLLLMMFVAAPILTPVFSQTETLIHNYWDSTPNSWNGFWAEYFAGLSASANYASHGQTFNISSRDYRLTKVSFLLKSNAGSPSNTLCVALFSLNETGGRVFGVNSIPNKPWGEGTELALSDSKLVALTSTPEEITFYFTGAQQYMMRAGTNYGIAVYVDEVDVFDESNHYAIAMNINAQYFGNRLTQYNATWAGVSNYDTIFRLYGILQPNAQETISSNMGIAAALMVSCFILVFIIHLVYSISSGRTEQFLEILTTYIISAIVLAGLSVIMLSM